MILLKGLNKLLNSWKKWVDFKKNLNPLTGIYFSMPDLEETKSRTLELFDERFNCGQSVIKAMTEALEMPPIQSTELIRAATVLGAGMSQQGRDCGALQAAAWVLGIKYGTVDPSQPRKPTYDKVRELYKMFEQRFGSVLCSDLTEYNLSTEEGRQKFDIKHIHGNVCPKYVSGVIEILFELMEYSNKQK